MNGHAGGQAGGSKRPLAAAQVVLLGAAGALLVALVGAGPAPAPSAASADQDTVSVDAIVLARPVTPHQISYLQGLFETKRPIRQAPGAMREEVPAFGAQPLSVNGVGTVFVPPESTGMVPDGDAADIAASLIPSRASYAPANLPMPPSGGRRPRLPHTVFLSYLAAEARERRARPGCHLDWPMLAGIGEIESTQAQAGRVRPDGTSYPPIYGPTLDGRGGYEAVPDTDHGRLDGDPYWDRAVGPMQFMPQTWEEWGSDGNGDGRADPQNVFDASLTAARYLCANGRDLAVPAQYAGAVLSYNDDWAYVHAVRAWARYYREGALTQGPPRPRPGPAPQPTPQPPPPSTSGSAPPQPTQQPTLQPTPSPAVSQSPAAPQPSGHPPAPPRQPWQSAPPPTLQPPTVPPPAALSVHPVR